MGTHGVGENTSHMTVVVAVCEQVDDRAGRGRHGQTCAASHILRI